MASIADVYVTVLPETGKIADGIKRALLAADNDVKAAAKRWKKEIEAELKDIKVKIDADPKEALRSAEALRHAIEGQPIVVELKLDPETGKAETQLDATARPRKAKIIADVDDASVAAAGRKISRNLSQSEGFFGKGGGVNLPFRATIPFPVALEAIGITPNVVPLIGSMTRSIGQLSGAFALLPAVIGATGLAFGSLKIGMSGFADAIKEIGDPEKFAEAISQLSPAAQQAATAIQGLMPQITQLKMTVQDALFTGMGEQFTKLGSTYLPVFQQIMGQMALSAGTAFGDISKMLQTPEMQSSIKAFGTNATTAFNPLAGAAQPFVKALLDIATVGSDFLPQLAGTVNELATRFADFIGEARETGKLQGWIQGGIDAFTDLKDIAVNVWDIFKGIFEAAGGGDFLDTVVRLTNTWSDWVNSVGGQNSLKAFFDEAKESLDRIWPILQDLGPILYNAFIGAKNVVDAFLPLVEQITGFIAKWPGLAEAFGVALGALSVASVIAKIGTIGTALLGLTTTAGTAATGISGALAGITAPAWLLTLLGGGAVAAVGIGVGQAVDRGYDITTSRFGPRPGHAGQPNRPTTPGLGGGGGSFAQPPSATPLPPRGAGRGSRPRGGSVTPPPPAPIPATSSYISPPMPTGGGGGAGGAGAPELVAPPGMSFTYSGYGELNWEALAQAESGGNWAINTGNGYFGGLQFDQATWEAYGGPPGTTADQFDKSDQIKVATALFNARGIGPWPANGWLLTATPEQLNQAGLTGSGRQSTSAGTRGRGGGGYGAGAPMPHDSRLQLSGKGNQGRPVSITESSRFVGEHLLQQFPGIKNIGTVRPDALQWHPSGRGLDVMINDPTSAEGKAQGDIINAYLQANKEALGIANTLWQVAEHYDHIHIGMKEGLSPAAQQGAQGQYGGDYTYDGPGMSADNPMWTESKSTGGEQLGKDIITGMLDVFGFGDIFKSPLDFEAFKLFKGIMGIPGKMFGGAQGAGGDSQLGGFPNVGGGGGGPGGFISNLLTGFGALNPGSPGNAPEEFIPGLISGSAGGGGIAGFMSELVPGAQPGQQGGMNRGGDYNVQINARAANAKDIGGFVNENHSSHTRQGLRNNPMP